MIDRDLLCKVVRRANLAPSVHNVQPTRWRIRNDRLELAAELAVGLSVGDEGMQDAGLSCGAAVEATLLALGEEGISAKADDHWDRDDRSTWPGHRMAAVLSLQPGTADPLAVQLDRRFTWRAAFGDEAGSTLLGSDDAHMFSEPEDKAWIAELNDKSSLSIMTSGPFRRELLCWMRLSPGHPRYEFAGLSREALQMPTAIARAAGWALGPLWPVLHVLKLTKALTAEAKATRSASVIAAFHVPQKDSQVAAGRRYLRLCLRASEQGYAGWPMAALTDDPVAKAAVSARMGLVPDRRLVQVLRFGPPAGPPPPRARRPIEELLG